MALNSRPDGQGRFVFVWWLAPCGRWALRAVCGSLGDAKSVLTGEEGDCDVKLTQSRWMPSTLMFDFGVPKFHESQLHGFEVKW